MNGLLCLEPVGGGHYGCSTCGACHLEEILAVPDVSIVLPVRNGARFLTEAIRSALQTAQPSRELIIIDDGSTDRTPDIIAAEAGRDSRIVALSQPPHGLVAALERGRRHARAPLIARLDADDLSYPARFERQVASFAAHRDLVLLGGAADKIDESGRIVGRLAYPTEPCELRREFATRNPFIHSTVMFKAECVDELCGYRPFFVAAEDYDLWLRLAEHGEIANLADTLGAVRAHAGSVSRQARERQMLSAAIARRCARARRRANATSVVTAEATSAMDSDYPAELNQNDIRLCHALEFALQLTFALRRPTYQNVIDLMTTPDFDREERRLAQRALANILERRALPDTLNWPRVAAALFRMSPVRAMRLVPQLLR